jgi:hypothetical protein
MLALKTCSSNNACHGVIPNSRCRHRSLCKVRCCAVKPPATPFFRFLNFAEALSLAGSCTMCVMIILQSRKQITPPALLHEPPVQHDHNKGRRSKRDLDAAMQLREQHTTQLLQESTDRTASLALGSIQNSLFLQGALLLLAILCRSISSLLSPRSAAYIQEIEVVSFLHEIRINHSLLP